MSEAPATTDKSGWAQAWPDLLAFVVGLATAWHFQWQTTDLVWSLWLSSLLVGYSMILWNIFGPVVRLSWEAHRNGATLVEQLGLTGAAAFVGLLMVAFFTVHFGMFHYVHSMFLNSFFPVLKAGTSPGMALYREVFRRYWYFVPLAAMAERRLSGARRRRSVTPGEANKNLARMGDGDAMMEPYKNVIRMHLLIFFFVAVHIAKLDGFFVYAVVYAVYFFPWRLLKRSAAQPVTG